MLLVVPGPDPEPWPTLGPQICSFIEERAVYGPGSLQGQPYRIDPEFRAFIYRMSEVYPRGHEWAGRRRFKRSVLSVRKGLAKCLAPEVPVLLASGREVRADEVGIGDVVLGYAGGVLRPARVSHVEVQSEAPMWRIVTERGRMLTVTAEHPMLVRGTRMLPGVPSRRRYTSCDPDRDVEQWVPASGLIVGDRLVVGLGWSGVGDLGAADAWLLGAFVGDGSPDGRFTSEDPQIVARIGERFPMTHCGRYDYYARGIRPFLREHDLLGCNSRAKRVPPAVVTAAPRAVVAFLAGYFDTDGWATFSPRPTGKTNSEIAWGSVNRELLVQCQTLLAGLGINGTVCESHGTYLGQPHLSWNLAVRDTAQAAALAALLLEHSAHPRKRSKLEQIAARAPGRVFARRDTDKVVSVEQVADSESIAVEVEGVHTHVTAGLVTHNTEKQAILVYVHVHPEGPWRCDGFDAWGDPVAAPVRAPYVPMLAYSLDQVEELAFGALRYVVENGPDADLFDSSLERVLRVDEHGRADGGAWPLAQSPNARDGARTTLNAFDEPHRLYEPRHVKAHETMDANLPKRPLEDPVSLYVGTAGKLGQRSVAEQLHAEALQIKAGKIRRPDLFYLYRTDDGGHDLAVKAERLKAVAEATGPAGEWGPGQFDDIASKWDRPGVDLPYLERVWLNRWVKHREQAFDANQVQSLARPGELIAPGSFVTLGFDGARFRDATGFVATDIDTGLQVLIGGWECPDDVEDWEVPEDEVTQALDHTMTTMDVWRVYADPPHWTETVASWAAKHPDKVVEWWTNRYIRMAHALRSYVEALDSGSVRFGGSQEQCEALVRHLTDAGRRDLKQVDDQGRPLWVLTKQDGTEALKFDFAMAAVLSWEACLDARRSGARPRAARVMVPRRIR